VSLFRPRKKTLLTLAVIVLAVALSGGFYLWHVPLDMDRYKGRIIAECEDITGATLTTGAATLRILPSPYIEVSDVRMSTPTGELLTTDFMKLHVSILPFFLKKVVIKKMTVEGWTLHVRRETDGSVALRDIYERIIKRKHIVSVNSMRLEEGRLVIEDKLGGRDLLVKAGLKRGQITLRGGAFNFQANLALEGGTSVYTRGTAEKVEGKIRIRGRGMVAGLDLATLSAYVKRPALKGSVSGDITFIYGNDLVLSGPVNYKDLSINEPSLAARPMHSPSGKASIAFRLKENTLTLKATKARLAMDDFIINGSMSLTGSPSEPEDLAIGLNLKTTPIPIKKVKSLVLDRIFSNKKLAWINEITPLGGAISVKGLTLNTTVKELRTSETLSRPGAMRLEAGLEGLNFRHAILGVEEIKDLNGGLILTDGSIDIHDVSAVIGTGSIKKLSYKMDNLLSAGKATSYDLSLLGHMDAGRAIALTIRVFRDSGESVKKQLRKISATGDTRIKFDLHGKIDVENSTRFSVNLGLKEATFRYEDFPISFTSLDGNIDVDNKRFTFTDLSMSDSANSRIKAEGYVRDYTAPYPYFHLKTSGSVYGGTLSALTSGTALDGMVLDDALSFSSTMVGEMKALDVKSDINLDSTGVEYQKLFKKDAGIALSISSELLLKDGEVEIKKAAISTAGTTLDVKGSFTPGQNGKGPYNIFIETKKARLYDLADITPLIIKKADTAGIVNIILKASRNHGEKSSIYSGLISVKKGSFATPLTEEPFKAFELFLDFEGDKAKLRLPEIKMGKSDLHGSIEVSSLSKKIIKFNLSSKRFESSDFWGDGEEAPGQWLAKVETLGLKGKADKKTPIRFTGSGKISVSTGRVLGEEVRDLKGVLQLRSEAISLDPIVFITKGGTVSGKTVLYRDNKSPTLFEGSASLTGLHLKELLVRLGAKKDILTGTLNGNIEIECQRGRTPFARCLNGKTYLKAERGRMWKFRIISKIFSIVNIISIDELFKKGLPYRSLTGDFAIKEGVISTDNLLFSSDSMKMSAVMDIDSADGTIEATLGIHPFVTIDKVVTTIPLIGWIIGGEEKSSVSLYYSIKGPLKKPVVEPARIKNIKKGIIAKMERLITSPIKIIKESSKMMNHKNKKGKSHE